MSDYSKIKPSDYPPKFEYKDSDLRWLDMGHFYDGKPRKLCYVKVEGYKQPGIICMQGYFTPMPIVKTSCVMQWAKDNGYPCVMFDLEGVGLSPPENFDYLFPKHWMEDYLAVLDQLTDGPQLIVGQCLGAWMACNVAQLRPHRIHSLVLIGPGYNHIHESTEMMIDKRTTEKQRALLNAGHSVSVRSTWGTDIKMKLSFFESAFPYLLNVEEGMNITAPIRVIHAFDDSVVPYERAVKLAFGNKSTDADLILRKHGAHRIMRPEDIRLELSVIQQLIHDYPVNPRSKL